MDTIASLRAFVAVAKTGSFSAAAQKLDLVPSVITKRVTQLERIVGTTLFHRSTRKVVLSADGEHHLERIIAAIAPHDQASTELRKGVRRLTELGHSRRFRNVGCESAYPKEPTSSVRPATSEKCR